MALRMEDRFLLSTSSLKRRPLPKRAMGAFLRNHDELTLEMVTDEERDYMYRAYANDPQMRVIWDPPEIGVTPGKDWNQIELMTHCCFGAGNTRPLLRRRDRDGRQHLPRRSQQRTHAHASGAPTGMPDFRKRVRTACIYPSHRSGRALRSVQC